MKRKIFFCLLFLAIAINPLFLNKKNLISILSKQDPINPNTLAYEYDSNEKIGYFDNNPVSIPDTQTFPILGETTSNNSNKRIEVNLTNQRLYAYENDKLIYSFLVSSGKWDRTPNGTFRIWTKIRSQKMSGGSRELGTYYYLPRVPYIMFFYNEKYSKQMGYSLHGTYWHNNFGVPMSHGCINMKTEEVAQLYSWAEVGTPITIYGKYQTSLPVAAR